ncbi:MAG TPA: fimbrial protein [Providencia sp.]|uniref:fimbrial protein n=1 Tax=Providencia sp. TaxID=589 RepID=UPI000E962EFD|nr:fimbrial protein [Providencia sp.]MBP6081779.1 fimbrial protein [Providencia sp.]HBO23479.1 fimbrial protein [Providencia sp.]
MKKTKYKIILVISLFSLYSGYSSSACVQNPTWRDMQKTIPNETINIQYDDTSIKLLSSISLPIYTGNYNPTNGVDMSCGGNQVGVYLTSVSNGMAISGVNGIGVRARINSFGPNYFFPVNGPYTDTTWTFSNLGWVINIEKIGQVTSGGVISIRQLARFYQQNKTTGTNFFISTVSFSNNYRINVLSCSLKNNQSTYNINMGDWYDTQFNNIGDTSDMVDIPISLTCKAGTNIKTTITSSGGYVDAATGKLALSGTNKATGVAIQLLDKNNLPVKLNTKNSLQNNVPAGDYLFNWKARYIKTTNTITPGTANATATVNIRYE